MITYGKEKNELLKQNRGIGFEEIISAIDSGKVLDVYYILKELNRSLRDVAGGGKINSQKTVLTFSGIIYDHPDQVNYPGQKIYVVEALDYVYLVPFIRNDEGLFLKTIIPSRKAKKMYKGDNNV